MQYLLVDYLSLVRSFLRVEHCIYLDEPPSAEYRLDFFPDVVCRVRTKTNLISQPTQPDYDFYLFMRWSELRKHIMYAKSQLVLVTEKEMRLLGLRRALVRLGERTVHGQKHVFARVGPSQLRALRDYSGRRKGVKVQVGGDCIRAFPPIITPYKDAVQLYNDYHEGNGKNWEDSQAIAQDFHNKVKNPELQRKITELNTEAIRALQRLYFKEAKEAMDKIERMYEEHEAVRKRRR